eukprot:CAMPEP_0172208584 /NCGR_PEP_ID=MMETSP1050-20130122/34561_1 /TAXON_ID=233186 /ORGANISM="Cryptomonas curvata, Strain CCAP979/52" /LENGTH=186 /DNA_ID=CAMNT_0012888207 /DNA_START=16 /DNA_END=576 /DNA_ORIENTATION=-
MASESLFQRPSVRSPSPRLPGDVGEYELSANWGSIFLALCAAPWAAFFLLNPISLFLEGWLFCVAVVATFVPKLLYFVSLEYAILNGNGSVFFEAHHTKRSRPSSGVMKAIVDYASMFGGVEASSRMQVAVVSKKYSGSPSTFPFYLARALFEHVKICWQVLLHTAMRWFALNIIARLYTKTKRTT